MKLISHKNLIYKITPMIICIKLKRFGKMSIVMKEKEIDWGPHPTVKDVKIKPLLTKKDHKTDMTVVLVNVKEDVIVPEHIHDEQDDILYVLSGKGKMWVDGIGEFELQKGKLVRVLKGTKHKIYDVKENLLIYDIFIPATI